jgi:hypothetical protein
MKKNGLYFCLSLFLIFMISGCNASNPTTVKPQTTLSPVQTLSPSPLVTSSPSPSVKAKDTTSTAPSFQIEGLHNGDVITQTEVNLQVILNNFTLVDRNSKQATNTNQGHIHYWLDTNPTDPGAAVQVDKDPQHILLSKLKSGEHILTIKLVGTDHQPATETTTQIITFMVKRPNIADSATNSPSTTSTPKPDGSKATLKPAATTNPNEADVKNASLAIVGLNNGDLITTEDLKFQIKVKGLSLVTSSDHPDSKAGEGHIHIWLDTTSTEPKAALKVYTDPKHIVIKHIAEGEHTIIVGLVSNDHQSIIGSRQAITFSVKHK